MAGSLRKKAEAIKQRSNSSVSHQDYPCDSFLDRISVGVSTKMKKFSIHINPLFGFLLFLVTTSQ